MLRTDGCERVACVLSALSALWVDSLDSRHSGPVETQTARVSRVERIRGVDPELNRGCAPGPPARLQPVDKSCHQQSRRI